MPMGGDGPVGDVNKEKHPPPTPIYLFDCSLKSSPYGPPLPKNRIISNLYHRRPSFSNARTLNCVGAWMLVFME